MSNNTVNRNIFCLTDKVAVVTGGAGILGQEFCRGLLEAGAVVALVDRDQAGIDFACQKLGAVYGDRVMGFVCDVSDESSVKKMKQSVEKEFGLIDILHNNAASKTSNTKNFFDRVEDFSLEAWREVSSVNIDGMFLVAREIGGSMADRGKGSIIQTSSIYGVFGPDNSIYENALYDGVAISTPAVYSATKAGVIGLTKYLATYWGSSGVRVNSISPGGVFSGQSEEFVKRYSSRIPLGRMAKKEEVVGALIFLASDASSYITGQNILVDGGLSAW